MTRTARRQGKGKGQDRNLGTGTRTETKTRTMRRKDRDRVRGMDMDSDIDRGKNTDMVDTVCMISFRYFSLMSISFRSQKSLFRFEATRAAHPRTEGRRGTIGP
jgi:hypothetical protein